MGSKNPCFFRVLLDLDHFVKKHLVFFILQEGFLYIMIRLGSQGSSKGHPPSTSMVCFVRSLLLQNQMGSLIFTHTSDMRSFSAAGFVNTWVDRQLYSSLCHGFPSDAKGRYSRYGIMWACFHELRSYEPLLSVTKAFLKKCFWYFLVGKYMTQVQSVQQPSMMLETSEKCDVKSPGIRRCDPIAILCDLS